jgi:GT2 family glycosyltransferase
MENSPKVSIIIPSLDGYREGNVEKLLLDLEKQSFKDAEIKLIKGIRPNGKARNVGSKEAKGKILIFIDDDVRLAHNEVLENLIRTLEADEKMAMAGASVKIYEDAGYLEKEYEKILNFSTPVTVALDYQGLVQHSCLAIKKSIFEEIGGENEDLITGTDIDLNTRIKNKGYKTALAPHTWVYHLMPDTIVKIIKKAFIWGVGSAYAVERKPEVFEFPKIKFTNYTIKTKAGVLFYKIITGLVRLPVYILAFKPVYFIFYFFFTIGYIYGWMKFKNH